MDQSAVSILASATLKLNRELETNYRAKRDDKRAKV